MWLSFSLSLLSNVCVCVCVSYNMVSHFNESIVVLWVGWPHNLKQATILQIILNYNIGDRIKHKLDVIRIGGTR